MKNKYIGEILFSFSIAAKKGTLNTLIYADTRGFYPTFLHKVRNAQSSITYCK